MSSNASREDDALMEYLLNCYQNATIFKLNNVEDVALILGLNVVSLIFRPDLSDDEQPFRDHLFAGVGQIINRSTSPFSETEFFNK